jgi:predicted TIM-barrel fold metal-dependent hydrolase
MTQTLLPPVLDLRAPLRQVPAGTIDCHAHIFDKYDQYPMDPARKYTPPVCTRESWLNMHRIMGVHRGVQVHGSTYAFDNSITEDFIRTDPDRFRAVAAIAPDASRAHIAKLHEAGFRAARLMDQYPNGATTRDLEKIADRIAEFGWHIEINILKGADWIGLEKRLMDCPVGLVFDHMGRIRGDVGVESEEFKVIRRLLDNKPDTWVKISSWYRMSDAPLPAVGMPDYPDMKMFAQTLLNHHVDRCVWGTNWPHPGIPKNMPDDIDLLDLLETWIPNETARQKLFVTNPEKLYDFKPFQAV